MNKNEQFLENAEKLDALLDSHGVITQYAAAITERDDDESAQKLIQTIVPIASRQDVRKEIRDAVIALENSMIEFYGQRKLHEVCMNHFSDEADKSLDELLDELNALIGLENVKQKVNDLITFQRVQKRREEFGLHSLKGTMHMAFIGNPGTGKTTVARIVGRVYKQIGLLSKGHFVEASRTDLIAGYQGQTALKVKAVIERSKGGVLFIDEAYSITENDHSDSYGRECLTELTKALEDYRDDLVVIVAGYTKPMEKFFESNPGLRSRFNTFIQFEDYSADELMRILESICDQNDYALSDGARTKIKDYLEEAVAHKEENFANGRFARNIYDGLVMNQAKRLIDAAAASRSQLSLIESEDFIPEQQTF